MVLLKSSVIFVLFIVVYVFAVEELCHPKCYVKCLPSCTCCNYKQPAETFAAFKRNEVKLRNLGRMIIERDLTVGFTCNSYCKKRCVPSCKFSCCTSGEGDGDRSATGSQAKSLIGSGEEFNLNRLLQAIEDTQREYLKLKVFIKKINATLEQEENLPEAVTDFSDKNKMPNLNNFHEHQNKHKNINGNGNKVVGMRHPASSTADNLDIADTSHFDKQRFKDKQKELEAKKEAERIQQLKQERSKNEHGNEDVKVFETIQTLQEKIEEEVKRRKLKTKVEENAYEMERKKHHNELVSKLKALTDAKLKLKNEFMKNTENPESFGDVATLSSSSAIFSKNMVDNSNKTYGSGNVNEIIDMGEIKSLSQNKGYNNDVDLSRHDNDVFEKLNNKVSTEQNLDETQKYLKHLESETLSRNKHNKKNLKEILDNIEAGHNSVILEVIDGSGTELSEIRVKKKKKKKKHNRKKLKKKLKKNTSHKYIRKDNRKKKIKQRYKNTAIVSENYPQNKIFSYPNEPKKQACSASCRKECNPTCNFVCCGQSNNTTSTILNQVTYNGTTPHTGLSQYYYQPQNMTQGVIPPVYAQNSLTYYAPSSYQQPIAQPGISFVNSTATNQNYITLPLNNTAIENSNANNSTITTVTKDTVDLTHGNTTVQSKDDTKEQIQTLISLLQSTVKQFDKKNNTGESYETGCNPECKKQCLPGCHFDCC